MSLFADLDFVLSEAWTSTSTALGLGDFLTVVDDRDLVSLVSSNLESD